MRGFGFRRKKTDGTAEPKKNKYGAKKVEIDGMVFDSKLESLRYLFLKDAQSKGIITDLQCQVQYELLPNMYKDEIKQLKTKSKLVQRLVQRKVVYTADFTYKVAHTQNLVVEDTKGGNIFTQSRDWPLRKKMMYYFHGIEVREVHKPTEPI